MQTHDSIGQVALAVKNLSRQRDFYERVIGLSVLDSGDTFATLGAAGRPILRLEGGAQASRPGRSPGLYHIAIRLPDRVALARAVVRLAQQGGDIQGVGDHGVSEAVYLSDPERNGIELYADRPVDDWPVDEQGQIEMYTDPLDLEGLLSELQGELQSGPGVAEGTRMGHVHLQVSDLEATRAFYQDVLGLNLIQRYGESALFLARGDYHHHVGANTWHSAGQSPAPEGSTGLRWFELNLPEDECQAALQRARAAGLALEELPQGTLLRDPSGNGVVLAG